MLIERIERTEDGDYTLAIAPVDSSGSALDLAAPATFTLQDGAGATVDTSGPTIAADAHSLSVTVSRDKMPRLDTYRAAWTATVGADVRRFPHIIQLVGGYLFEVAELREVSEGKADIAQATDAAIALARLKAEVRLETAADVAFVPRASRFAVRGWGTPRIRVPARRIRQIYEASVDGEALTAEETAALLPRAWGAVDLRSPYTWPRDALVELWYEHGRFDWPPGPVSEAAMTLAREYLIRSNLASRQTVEVNEFGTFRLGVATRDRPTGIPEVDAVIRDFGEASSPLIG